MSELVLEARSLTRRFHPRIGLFHAGPPVMAVRMASLGLGYREALGIIGESGSGKSVLAAMLAGLDTPDVGEILVAMQDLDTMPRWERARRVQLVLADSLDPRRSVQQIIGAPLVVHRIGRRAARMDRIVAMMERVGLPVQLRTARPAQLSEDERQRVALCRALVIQPDVLICDDILRDCDRTVQTRVLALLRRLRSELNCAVMLLSRDPAQVQAFADRVLILQGGAVVEQGDTDWLFAHPSHPHTQALLNAVG